MRFSMFALWMLAGCGIEETGYLTGGGVYFTTDGDASRTLVVVRPDAVAEVGGALSLTTFEGEEGGARALQDDGAAWLVGATAGARLRYTLDGRSDEGDYAFALAPGEPPVENPVSLVGPWLEAQGSGLVVRPDGLIGDLPMLVVNQVNGASVWVDDLAEQPLRGAPGDRVCASSVASGAATPSLCVEAP